MTVPGATTDFAARVLLQQVRLTPGKDVKLLYLKGQPEILAGINQGNADAGKKGAVEEGLGNNFKHGHPPSFRLDHEG